MIDSTPEIDRVFAELHRLAGANGRHDVKKFDQVFNAIGGILNDMNRRLDAIEKSRDPLAHQPPRLALASWSTVGLTAALAEMSAAKLAKLRQ